VSHLRGLPEQMNRRLWTTRQGCAAALCALRQISKQRWTGPRHFTGALYWAGSFLQPETVPHQSLPTECDRLDRSAFGSKRTSNVRQRRRLGRNYPCRTYQPLDIAATTNGSEHSYRVRIVQFVLSSSVKIGPNRTQRWPSNFII